MNKLEQAARQALEVLKNQSPDRDMVRAAFALQEALAEQAEQEPVVKIHKYNEFQTLGSLNLPIGTKLYAAPVRTKDPCHPWQDLTDDEIYTLYSEPCSDREMIDFARAVIAADREKNNANNNT